MVIIMSRKSRVLEGNVCEITQEYKDSSHKGIDIVGKNYTLDNIVAHSNGTVVQVTKDCNANTNGENGNSLNRSNPSNMVKIDHGNGYQTRYLHLAYGTVKVSVGQKVPKGQALGYMGNTGYSFGGHLHFEVMKDNNQIDPTNYLENDLPINTSDNSYSRKIGDKVIINGVYVSSTSDEKFNPLITEGVITRIVIGARNPYLLDNGNIGWVNDECIVNNVESIEYLFNPNYNGNSIVDALKQINIDSSYSYRSKLASANGISDYRGIAEQNLFLLDKLKKGQLKKV